MKMTLLPLLLVPFMVSCEKNLPNNGGKNFGTSIRLNTPTYGENHDYKVGEIGTHPICNGSFDFGRNYGNLWSFNEFDNSNIKHHEKYYTDSIGYIQFGEGGIGELVMVNQDSIHLNIPFTYEIVKKDKNYHYLRIDWENVKVRTYVSYENGGSPLNNFGYTFMGEMSFNNGKDIYKWEGSMNDYNGMYTWGGNYVSYYNK